MPLQCTEFIRILQIERYWLHSLAAYPCSLKIALFHWHNSSQSQAKRELMQIGTKKVKPGYTLNHRIETRYTRYLRGMRQISYRYYASVKQFLCKLFLPCLNIGNKLVSTSRQSNKCCQFCPCQPSSLYCTSLWGLASFSRTPSTSLCHMGPLSPLKCPSCVL
jgi:hypothetical protein